MFNFKKKEKNKRINSMIFDEFKNELFSNSFLVSYGICVIIIGIISCWFSGNYCLLIGVSLSVFLFSIFSCYKNGNSLLNIFPVFIILLFGFFPDSVSKIPVVNVLLNKNLTNLIIFLSLGITILTQCYKNIKNRLKVRTELLLHNMENTTLITNQAESYNVFKVKLNNIKVLLKEKKIEDKEIKQSLDDILEFTKNTAFLSNVKSSLSKGGVEQEKTTFTINEIEDAIVNYTEKETKNPTILNASENVRVSMADFNKNNE